MGRMDPNDVSGKIDNAYGLYSIRDLVADEYGPVFTAKNDAVAVRNFGQLLTAQKVAASEYTLHRVGIWDADTGTILSASVHQIHVYLASDGRYMVADDAEEEDKHGY